MTVALALLLGVALAADPDPAAEARARELYDNGAILYDEGRYEDAIAAWEEAFRLSGRPLLLYNMANAAERLGDWDRAMELLSRYRAFAPAEERETLDRRIRNIERRLDEARAAVTPAPPPVVTATPPPEEPERRGRVLPWVLGGVGVVGVGTGSVFGAQALGARADAAELCTEVGGATWCDDAARGPLRTDRTRSLLADVGFGVGGVALVGAVVSAAVPRREVQGLSLQVGVGDDGAAVALGGRF